MRLFILFLLAISCSTPFRKTTTRTIASKEENCTYDILSVLPYKKKFFELGVIELEEETRLFPNFKRQLGNYICKAGGDAVLIRFGGDEGMYIKGIVLKYDSEEEISQTKEPAPIFPERKVSNETPTEPKSSTNVPNKSEDREF